MSTPLNNNTNHVASAAAATANASTAPREALPVTSSAQQADNISHSIAGSLGGIISMALTYPLISISTRKQVVLRDRSKAEISTLQAAKDIIDREGPSGLYKGLSSALVGVGVSNAIFYYAYEYAKAILETAAIKSGRPSKRLTTLESLLAGALSGAVTCVATNPLWVVSTRMAANSPEGKDIEKGQAPPKSKTTLATLSTILKEEPLALFNGLSASLVLCANPSIQYAVYEQLKNILETRRKRSVTAWDSFILGSLAKLVATTVTFSYIVVKSRAYVQAQAGRKDGLIGSVRRIWREEGIAGLYAGYTAKITQSVLTAAFLFLFKDVLYDLSVRLRQRAAGKIKAV